MKINLIFTVLLFIFATLVTFAQDTFVPGYYMDRNGNKMECLIKQLGWANTPQNFKFKINKNSRPEMVDIENIQEFAIEGGRKFIKYTLDIDQSFNDELQDKINASYNSNSKTLSTDSLPDWETQTLLLETIVEGNVDLLNYKSGTKNRFFIKKSNKLPKQLIYKKFKVKSDNSTLKYNLSYGSVVKSDTIKENNTYKIQLAENANCINNSLETFNELQYAYEELKSFVLIHNLCIDPLQTKEYVLPSLNKGKINLYAFGRGSDNQFKMNSSIVGVSFDAEYALYGGIEIEFLLPYRNKKWTPFLQFNYNSYGGASTKTIRSVGSIDIDEQYTFKASAMEIPVGLRHNFYLNDKNLFFIDAAFNILVNVGEKHASRANDLEYLLIYEKPNFIYGGGFKTGKFRLGVHYQYRRFIKQIAWYSRYQQISVDLGWQIF